ncbi:MAG: penicillin-binding transpeptidase domain-containing protein, partial [Firmicutes bacterium]|nr:penicillin-binding transpeptidase domain-containing protein [Bacillota bacterium]
PVKSVYVNPDIFTGRVKAGEGENRQEKEKDIKENVVRQIAAILALDEASTLKTMISKQPFSWLKHKVDYETCQKLTNVIKENKVTGIGFIDGTRRSYPQGMMAAHVLGFVGMDVSARGGIEKSFDAALSGVPGRVITETDASGRELPQTRSNYIPPSPGMNLVLTLDHTIQYYVERELDKIDEKYKPSRAAIIVMDPVTGEILAMGSRPTYDPVKYASYPQAVWDSNPATNYTYEPGSTLKMCVAAMALEEGIVREDDRFYDPGYIVVNDKKIKCWDTRGHGAQSFSDGIKNSCNPVFIQTGLKSGKALFYQYISAFGFGQRTGCDLPGEETGVLIPESKARELDLATMSIGQSIAVTPVQLITAVSSIANGGYLVRPYLVRAVEDPESKAVTNIEPRVVRQVISQNTSLQMKRLLQRVILEGSGKKAFVEGYAVAGKTGTAQVPGQGGYVEGKYVSSFAGFAPADNPRIAVLVLVAEPKGEAFYGGDVAAPVFQAVARDTLHYLNVPENPGLPGPKIEQKPEEKPALQEESPVVRVPNVTGFPVEEAVNFLKESGFKPDASGKQGLVAEQKPPGNSYGKKGTVVSVKTASFNDAKPPSDILVPDMRGLTIRRAGSILDRLGLSLKSSGSGIAVSQNPPPGQRAARGALVSVEFAPPKN